MATTNKPHLYEDSNKDSGFYLVKHPDIVTHSNYSNVSSVIGDEYKKWITPRPIFIDAPTGSGKSTFVYEKLIPDAIAEDRGVLIVSNRIALSMQQKRHIYEVIRSIDPDYLNNLRQEEIAKETTMIGPVCVTTYQGMYKLFNPDLYLEKTFGVHSIASDRAQDIFEWSKTVKYAVFDEIHFLYADAEFNEFCHMLLKYIPSVFHAVIRVYMTATSWEIYDYISNYEFHKYDKENRIFAASNAPYFSQELRQMIIYPPSNQISHSGIFQMHHYIVSPDHSRYNLKFFSTKRKGSNGSDGENEYDKKAAAVIDLLSSKMAPNDKAIVFVDSKDAGKQIFSGLKSRKITAAYIDREESNPKNLRLNLLEGEKFNERVLITTSVLDSGINIVDNAVRHVVIFYTDRTQFIQALGRKRLQPNEEAVNVWAYAPSNQALSWQERKYYNNALAAMQLLYAGYYDPSNPRNDINKVIKNIATPILTKEDLSSFCSLSKNKHSSDYAYYGGFQKITAELYKSNPEPPTLTYINSDGRIYCNFYVLGVILRKMHFLMQFVFPNKDDLIKDYRQVVGEWLDKPNILEEISRENEAAIQGEKAGLEKLLRASLQRELTDKSFDPIRTAIINAHINAIPNSELKKRNSEYKRKMGDKALSRLLSELGLPYEISSRRKNSGGKNNSVWHAWTISRL